METKLHRQLKERFAGKQGQTEVKFGRYRIDVVRGNRLIEIQQSSLAAIRDKVQVLCRNAESSKQRIEVVKPLITRKKLIKLDCRGGQIVSERWSPKRGKLVDMFGELVYFTRAFPHPRLTVTVIEIEVEETRYPGHGKRRRRRDADFQVEEIKIVDFGATHHYRQAKDWFKLIPGRLPKQFDTAVIASKMQVDRWEAQRAAYCLRKIGAIEQVGKKGNALLYSRSTTKKKAA